MWWLRFRLRTICFTALPQEASRGPNGLFHNYSKSSLHYQIEQMSLDQCLLTVTIPGYGNTCSHRQIIPRQRSCHSESPPLHRWQSTAIDHQIELVGGSQVSTPRYQHTEFWNVCSNKNYTSLTLRSNPGSGEDPKVDFWNFCIQVFWW